MARAPKEKKRNRKPAPRERTEAEKQAARAALLERLRSPIGIGGGDFGDAKLPPPPKPGGVTEFVEKTGKEIKNAGRDINKAAIAGGKAVEHVAQQIGIIGDRLGKAFEKGMCDLFAPNQGCSIGMGAGVDQEGSYTFDPADPEKKYRPSDTSENAEMQRMIDNAKHLEQSLLHPWEEDAIESGATSYAEPNTDLGSPWPAASKEVRPPTASGEVRGCDAGGCGGFMQPRRSKNGVLRYHLGMDYLTTPGESIYAPIDGVVTRFKNPDLNKPKLKGVLITNKHGYSTTVFYISPTVKPGDVVKAGKTEIGVAQDIHPEYPTAVPNHVHVELADPNGNSVPPDGKKWKLKKTPPDGK